MSNTMDEEKKIELTSDDRPIIPYDKRRGFSICIISRGVLPSNWFKHIVEKVTKNIPSGLYWNYIIEIGSPETTGQNYAALRTKCVEEALARGSKWMFFVDDDVFAPEHVIGKMIEHTQNNMKIISGLYYKKSDKVEPVIFKRLGDGPYYKYPINEVIEIEGSGAGCVWIDTSVFDEFRKANVPYFKQDWLMQLDQGSGRKMGIQVEIGEDHWLYHQAKQLGIKSYCDTSLNCDHFCSKRNRMFPIPEEVYRIRGKTMNKKEKIDLKKFKERKKPNIAILCPSVLQFNGNSLKEKPLGGSETAIIHVAKRLAKDNNVMVLAKVDKEGVYDDVVYFDVTKVDILNGIDMDVMIMSRNINMLGDPEIKKRIKAKQYWLWTQDYPMYPGFENFLNLKGKVDKYICVSNDHRDALLQRFPCQLEEEKIIVIENGVDSSLFKEKVERKKNQFYYSSTPFRGLEVLVDLFPRIRERVPDATLKVCSSMKVYGDLSGDKKFEKIFDKCKRTEGIELLGSLKQDKLAKIAQESYALLYPSTFAETNCITVAEAQTAGTPIVCNDLGALKETVHKGCGIIVPGNPRHKEWQDRFVDKVVKLCEDEKLWNTLHKHCLKQNFDWEVSVKKWKKELKDLKTSETKLIGERTITMEVPSSNLETQST